MTDPDGLRELVVSEEFEVDEEVARPVDRCRCARVGLDVAVGERVSREDARDLDVVDGAARDDARVGRDGVAQHVAVRDVRAVRLQRFLEEHVLKLWFSSE